MVVNRFHHQIQHGCARATTDSPLDSAHAPAAVWHQGNLLPIPRPSRDHGQTHPAFLMGHLGPGESALEAFASEAPSRWHRTGLRSVCDNERGSRHNHTPSESERDRSMSRSSSALGAISVIRESGAGAMNSPQESATPGAVPSAEPGFPATLQLLSS